MAEWRFCGESRAPDEGDCARPNKQHWMRSCSIPGSHRVPENGRHDTRTAPAPALQIRPLSNQSGQPTMHRYQNVTPTFTPTPSPQSHFRASTFTDIRSFARVELDLSGSGSFNRPFAVPDIHLNDFSRCPEKPSPSFAARCLARSRVGTRVL